MLHEFLDDNRSELIERCRAKVAQRLAPRPSRHEMEHGIPQFLDQLIAMLRMEQGATGVSEAQRLGNVALSNTATKHGHELLELGFTVTEVVHDYGDLGQAVTELATEHDAAVSSDEFNTFNRCLDNAIADAVTEFAKRRDVMISATGDRAMGERLGILAHELRNFLNTAMLSFAVIKQGKVGVQGATSAVLDRSLAGLQGLVDRALADVRLTAGVDTVPTDTYLDEFIADAQVAASLDAKSRGRELTVFPVERGISMRVDVPLLHSALSNLLQNAFKFTPPLGNVTLSTRHAGDRVVIEVADQCGGLPHGFAETMFKAFEQHATDRSGLGLGLSIARRAVEACGGTLLVHDHPGRGCVFAIDLPGRRDGPPAFSVARPEEAIAPSLA